MTVLELPINILNVAQGQYREPIRHRSDIKSDTMSTGAKSAGKFKLDAVLSGFSDFSCFNTACANHGVLPGSILKDNTNTLKIR